MLKRITGGRVAGARCILVAVFLGLLCAFPSIAVADEYMAAPEVSKSASVTALGATDGSNAEVLKVEQDAASQKAASGQSSTLTEGSASGSLSDSKGIVEQAASGSNDVASIKTSASTIPQRTIDDGLYVIETANNLSQVVEVAGGSADDGGNVQTYSSNLTGAQLWSVTYDSASGYYSICNENSKKALDVAGGSATDGANVQQYVSNGSKAQQWQIVVADLSAKTYKLVSALNPNLVLDVFGGYASSGTNLQIYSSNDTAAQRFIFLTLNPNVAAAKTIDDGCYTVALSAKDSSVIDIAGSSLANGANAQVYDSNSTSAQKFYFAKDTDDDFYTIANIASGKLLDVSGSGIVPGTNVWQYAANGSKAQKWSVIDNNDGTYTFMSMANGLVLDIASGSTANGANVQVYTSNLTAAQRFKLIACELVSTGVSTVRSLLSGNRSIDVPGGATQEGVQLQTYDYNGTFAQKYLIEKVSDSGNAYYTFQVVGSGKCLADSSGTVVQQNKSGDAVQQWIVTWGGDGIKIINRKTGLAIDVAGAISSNGALLQTYKDNGTMAQRFSINPASVIDAGLYTIVSAIGSKVVDVAGGSKDNGANVAIWTSNNTNAQKYYFELVDGYYKIMNARSKKVLDVAGGAIADGSNVWQYDYNGSDAQLWQAVVSDNGGVIFINKGSGTALDVAGGVDADGANIDIKGSDGSDAQRWTIRQTDLSIEDSVLEYAIAWANGQNSSTDYLICVNLSAHKVVVFQGSQGAWNVVQYWDCTNGAPSTPTVVGDFTIGSRGYSFGSGYTCYYWTQFYGNYLFHSVLYYQGTNQIMDGTLGAAASHGCIRLDINNAYWINQVIPSGTRVHTYY